MRAAILKERHDELETIQRYMPGNYDAVGLVFPDDTQFILIVGEDVAGWTMEDYVIPRLASGLHFATEFDVRVKITQEMVS